ncbi:MAG: C10 family peptidase, partial [Bacteroidales bacterium]|nr:C10 family peptidase [Bacteroidales bacterium]
MKNRLFILAVSIIVSGLLRIQAQSVSFAEAEQIAQHFFGKVHKSMQNSVSVSVEGQDTLLYVFNANNGFVVISGEKKAVPILAYSYESNYDAEHVIPPVQMWMNSYHKQLLALRQDATQQQSISVSKAWKELQTPPKIHKNTPPPPTPLLTSKWGQGELYNFYCPKDEESTSNKRAVTGCVATAMAQLMYYFRYPEKGTGENSYKHDIYDTLSADFSQTTYNYNAMLDDPQEKNLAASLLTYHCGIAVNMNYGAHASSALSATAARALKKHFGYSPKTQLVHRQGSNDWDTSYIPWDSSYSKWDSLIIDNLDRRIPLYYAGTDTAEYVGHAFVCDAYQVDSNGNYFYHFNFGWDGHQDGYFYTNPLLGTSMAYHVWQDIIINAFPDTANFNYPIQPPLTGNTLLTAEAGSFTDGTIYDCPPNMDYTWIIQPDVDDITRIQFKVRYNLAEGDTLFVTSPKGKINTAFTNNTLTFNAEVEDTEITVRLKTTNDTLFSGGFSANYVTTYPKYCIGGIREYFSKQGSFGDGSGNSRYNN